MDDERVRSGIPGLDELLEGGFPRNGVYVIIGESGTGKSIFATQFLYNGALHYNETGIYVVLEENRNSFMSNMKEFGFDIEKLEKENRIKMVPYIKSILGDVSSNLEAGLMSNDVNTLERVRQYLAVNSLFMQIQESCDKLKAKRIVVDPVSLLTMLTESEVLARMQLISFFEGLRKLGVTVLMTVEEGVKYSDDICFLADGVIHLIMKEKNNLFERGLTIKKMRGTAHDTGLRPLKIKEDGIRVYPNEVMFK